MREEDERGYILETDGHLKSHSALRIDFGLLTESTCSGLSAAGPMLFLL